LFTSSGSPEKASGRVTYILSPCNMMACGLANLLAAGQTRALFFPGLGAERALGESGARFVVYLPDRPYWLLVVLRQVAQLLDRNDGQLSMLILSRSSASWVWRSLQKLVKKEGYLSGVRVAPSDLPSASLAALLRGDWNSSVSLKKHALEEELVSQIRPEGLTRKELDVLVDSLAGQTIQEQAKQRGVSHKTLYVQRMSGLKKMAHPLLHEKAPMASNQQKKGDSAGTLAALSPFERELVYAIHNRHIYPVFQPIVNGGLQLKGLEILARWHRNGQTLQPAEFLPQIRSSYTWRLLTAFMLQEAVGGINQYQGEYYFAVNIPAEVSNSESLFGIIKQLSTRLINPFWTDRLVLEISEDLNLQQQQDSRFFITQLQHQGYRVMLDDCFSQSSVYFPVRAVRFNDYKLDRKVVADAQYEPHALALIKSLAYYCELTGSYCVAEGIDSREKLRLLLASGVHLFQGYSISQPVFKFELRQMIAALKKRETVQPIA